MKVNYTLKDGYLSSFSVIPFDATKPFIKIEKADEELIMTGKCKIIDNKLDTAEAKLYLEELANNKKLQDELFQLNTWMASYDEQLMLYNRQMHLYGKSSIDINKLDIEARLKLDRIVEIENSLK